MFLAQTLESPRLVDGLMTARIPASVDIAAVRRRIGMSQEAFADHIGVSLFTLRNWEQGKRSPEGPALVLLAMLERDPDIVDKLLGQDDA